MWRWRRTWEGRGHTPRASWSPQMLAEAGRSCPWGLWRECSPAHLDLRRRVSRAGRTNVWCQSPIYGGPLWPPHVCHTALPSPGPPCPHIQRQILPQRVRLLPFPASTSRVPGPLAEAGIFLCLPPMPLWHRKPRTEPRNHLLSTHVNCLCGDPVGTYGVVPNVKLPRQAPAQSWPVRGR